MPFSQTTQPCSSPPLFSTANDLTRRVRPSSGRVRSSLRRSFPYPLSFGQSPVLAPSPLPHSPSPSRKASQRPWHLCTCPSSIPLRSPSSSLPALRISLSGSTPFSRPLPSIDLDLPRSLIPVQVSSSRRPAIAYSPRVQRFRHFSTHPSPFLRLRLPHPISAWYPRSVTSHSTGPTLGHRKRVCSPKYRRDVSLPRLFFTESQSGPNIGHNVDHTR